MSKECAYEQSEKNVSFMQEYKEMIFVGQQRDRSQGHALVRGWVMVMREGRGWL